jgi:TPR repeat protein
MTKRVLALVARAATVAGLCAGLAACVTARATAPADLELLAMALSEPVAGLSGQAETGQARAQYAMAVLHAYGARGVAQDPDQAAALRRKALAARGFTPIATYIAGLRGKPGRVAIINTPRYDLNAGQALRTDQCAAALARGDESPAAVEACAGPQELARLKALWAEAKSGH